MHINELCRVNCLTCGVNCLTECLFTVHCINLTGLVLLLLVSGPLPILAYC